MSTTPSSSDVQNSSTAPTEGVICLRGNPEAENIHIAEDGGEMDDLVWFFAQGDGAPPATGVDLAIWLQNLSVDDIAAIRKELTEKERFQTDMRVREREYWVIPLYHKRIIGETCGHSLPDTLHPDASIYWKDIYENIRGIPALNLLLQGKLPQLPFNYTLPMYIDSTGNTDEDYADVLPPSEFVTPDELHHNRWRYIVDFDDMELAISRDRDDGTFAKEWTWSFQQPRAESQIRIFMESVQVEANGWQSSSNQAPGDGGNPNSGSGSWQMA